MKRPFWKGTLHVRNFRTERVSVTWLVSSMGKSATESRLASSPWLHLTTSHRHLEKKYIAILNMEGMAFYNIEPCEASSLKQNYSVKILEAYNYVSTCDSSSIFFLLDACRRAPLKCVVAFKISVTVASPQSPLYENMQCQNFKCLPNIHFSSELDQIWSERYHRRLLRDFWKSLDLWAIIRIFVTAKDRPIKF